MKTILVILSALYALSAFADPSATKPVFKIGDHVRVASCKSERGKDWVSDGYPEAHLAPIRGCGKKGVVVDIGRACAPEELHLDSCDPWSYFVRIDDLDEREPRDTIRYYSYALGKGKPVRNRFVDFACTKKQKNCNVEGKKK